MKIFQSRDVSLRTLNKSERLLCKAIEEHDFGYITEFVSRYLQNKDEVKEFNIIDAKLYELLKDKEQWMSVIDESSEIAQRLQKLFEQLKIYFW